MDDLTGMRAPTQGQVIRELFVFHQLLSTRLARRLRPLGLSLSHVSFLTHLSAIGGQSSFADLAAALEVNQPAASKHMRALKERGAIVVTGENTDGRRRHVSLTDAGRALLVDAHVAMHPEATLAFAHLDDPDLAALLATLSALRTQLEHTPSAAP